MALLGVNGIGGGATQAPLEGPRHIYMGPDSGSAYYGGEDQYLRHVWRLTELRNARLVQSPKLPLAVRAASGAINDSASGTITLTGSRTESQTHTASATATITLSGSVTQSASHIGSGIATLTLTGTRADSQIHTATAAGTVTLSGSAAENFQPPAGGSSADPNVGDGPIAAAIH